jgi:hypothetical protein
VIAVLLRLFILPELCSVHLRKIFPLKTYFNQGFVVQRVAFVLPYFVLDVYNEI